MRMRISVTRFAVCCPAGMSYTGRSLYVFSYQAFFKLGYFSFFLMHFKAVIQQRDSGTVISAVLKSFKAFQNHRVSFSVPDISNNSTHSNKVLMIEGV